MTKRYISAFIVIIVLFSYVCIPSVNATKCEGGRDIARKLLNEGAVLIKNDNNILPISSKQKISVFGSAQIDYLIGGGGSSVMFTDYDVSPLAGIKKAAESGKFKLNTDLAEQYESYVGERKNLEALYGDNAFTTPAKGKDYATFEMPLTEDIVAEAASKTDIAIYFLSRYATEGADMKAEPGSYYLTDEEKNILSILDSKFEHICVVLNIPSAIDTSWFASEAAPYDIEGAMIMWYGGEETGNAIASLLCGAENPSGKLTLTFAKDYTDYLSSKSFDQRISVNYEEDIFVGYRQFETFDPEYTRVNFPFGYGLSYTSFAMYDISAKEENGNISVSFTVVNTGDRAGKEVMQVYYSCPQGVLGKPQKELAGFVKTGMIKPGKQQTLTVTFPVSDMSSYDDTGKLNKSAYILEKGEYNIYLGNSIKDAGSRAPIYTFAVQENTVTQQLTQRVSSTKLTKRLLADGSYETLDKNPLEKNEQKIEGKTNMASIPENEISFRDVYMDNSLMDAFLAQLTVKQMAQFAGGEPGDVGYAAGGVGGKILGTYRVPNISVTDGTSGVRVDTKATYFPCSICCASTWNTELCEVYGTFVGKECQLSGIDIWLAPGLNIIRNPLCGRNFEYCSEDPLVSGIISAAITRGVQKMDISVCLKHYAANNKEANRGPSDSQVTERALREIYLKSFEICLSLGDPWCIMTTCGTVNGTGLAGNYDFMYAIPRIEWGYDGVFMSDWANMDGEVYELWAGHNLGMPDNTPSNLISAFNKGDITRAQLEWNTECILRCFLKLYTVKKMYDESYTAPDTDKYSDSIEDISFNGNFGEHSKSNTGIYILFISLIILLCIAILTVLIYISKRKKLRR